MSAIDAVMEPYFRIVKQIVFADDPLQAEQPLAEAFELGRALVTEMVSPDEVSCLHHEAVIRLARDYPDLSLGPVAERLTRPLMEMSMAYGLAFREQMAQRYEAAVSARLEQSSKLEAVGMLAAGMAHDFNNIVGSIVGFSEMTEESLAEGSSEKANMRQVLVACTRARDLVARMLAFARQNPGTPVRLELVSEVGDTLTMLSASLEAHIEVRFRHGMAQAWIMAAPGQIQQIVMNLCLNAADAMEGRGQLDIGLALAQEIERVPPGRRDDICLTVRDTGCGMSPEVQARVFDPFFTTKAPHGGSGLGLSVVYGIVKDLGGGIEVASRSTGPGTGTGTGTEFRIFLPSAPAGESRSYTE